jgi:hypothetical protein
MNDAVRLNINITMLFVKKPIKIIIADLKKAFASPSNNSPNLLDVPCALARAPSAKSKFTCQIINIAPIIGNHLILYIIKCIKYKPKRISKNLKKESAFAENPNQLNKKANLSPI